MDSELQKALDAYGWQSPPVGWSDDAIADLWFDLGLIVEAARKVANLNYEAAVIALVKGQGYMAERQAREVVDAALGITE